MKKIITFCILSIFILHNPAFSAFNFIDNGNGTVTDARTGLVWLKNANPCGTKNWYDAGTYCSSLASGQAGLTDGSTAGQWRLPSKEELEGIGTDPPATWDGPGTPYVTWTMPGTPFTSVQPNPYWSGPSYAYISDEAWLVTMDDNGYVYPRAKSYADYYVWPVRESIEPTSTTTTVLNSGGEIIQITSGGGYTRVYITTYGHVYFTKGNTNEVLYFYNGNTVAEIGNYSEDVTLSLSTGRIAGDSMVYVKKDVNMHLQVHLFDGTKDIQITNTNDNNVYPAINDNGYIAWTGHYDGNTLTGDIFLYKPALPTAVQMSALKATPSNKQVKVQWQTETETDNAGFNVWRAEGFQKINESMITAEGSPIMGADYDFFDRWVMNGKLYYYLVEDIDNNGICTFHGPVKAKPRWIYGVGR